MLEIPESTTISKQLNETIQGKTIKYVKANKSPHKFAWYSGDPENYNDLLAGKKIGTSYARSGMIEIEAEDYRILCCDGAALRFYDEFGKAPVKNQLCIEFTDGSALIATIQMYGGLWAFKEGENDNPYYLGACRKISPFSSEFTFEHFESLYTQDLQNKSVKAFLATEQRIPGLGNGVLQDILFEAGLHPKRKMNTLTKEDRRNLYATVKKVLNEMTENGGRDTEKDLLGNPGRYITYLSKNTYGGPCSRCGYPIQKEAFLGGTVYYCEHCQKEK